MDKETMTARCTYLTTKISLRTVAWVLALVMAFKLTVTYFNQDRSSDAKYHKTLDGTMFAVISLLGQFK